MVRGLTRGNSRPVAAQTRLGAGETASGAQGAETVHVPNRVPDFKRSGAQKLARCPSAPGGIVMRGCQATSDRVDQLLDTSAATSRVARTLFHECALGFCEGGFGALSEAV